MKFKIDNNACSGCRVCQTVCALTHFKQVNPKKAALQIDAHFPEPGTFTVRVCTQCGICSEVCPENAITIENGVYLIEKERCTKCGLCISECPFEVLTLRDDVETPIKCDNCGECIRICPKAALMDEEGGIENDIRLF